MAGHQGSGVQRAMLEEAVAAAAEAERADIWTALPGRLLAFDAEAQTATVEVLYRPRHNGVPMAMPPLGQVPVHFPRGGGFAMTWPLRAGDGGQIIFQCRDIDAWHGSGGPEAAPTARMHDLSDAVFVPGLEPSPRKLAAFNAENFELRTVDGRTKIEISPDGRYAIDNGTEELLSIIDEMLSILETQQAHVTFGSSAGTHPITTNTPAAGLRARFQSLKLR